jgi:hypothetical protein
MSRDQSVRTMPGFQQFFNKVVGELRKLGHRWNEAEELARKYPTTVESGFALGSYPYYPANQICAREKDGRGDDPTLDQVPVGEDE